MLRRATILNYCVTLVEARVWLVCTVQVPNGGQVRAHQNPRSILFYHMFLHAAFSRLQYQLAVRISEQNRPSYRIQIVAE